MSLSELLKETHTIAFIRGETGTAVERALTISKLPSVVPSALQGRVLQRLGFCLPIGF